jgi:thiol-disulfide isomerase/thioredoxin
MRRWLILIAAGAALSGCKTADKDRPRDDRTADPASRTRPAPADGKKWLDGPNPGLGKVGTPPADSWADPGSPGYDLDREVRGVLAGFVEDPDGRKVRDVFIEVEPAGAAADGAPVGVQTGRDGYFLIKGLKPKQTYQLTARAKLDGHDVAGRVYAQTSNERSQFIRIALIDGLSFPGGGGAQPGGGRDLPAPVPGGGPKPADKPTPPGAAIPPPVLPSGGTGPREPLLRGGEGTGLPLPGPADAVPDLPRSPAAPSRPDLVTEGPDGGFRPPPTSIPPPDPPATTPPPKTPATGTGRSSRSSRSGPEFTLLDTLGVPREFATGRPGELVLLDFMTTSCVPCRQTLPVLRDLQARYGLRGLDVVGVACDEADLAQRRALAAAYQRTERLNYLLYTEPTAQPGKLRERFGVQGYPTLVLLDGSGAVLWKGHPKDGAELQQVIEDELARRPR